MKSDFDMIVRRFDGDICIYPIADVHFGSIDHDEKGWSAFCSRIKDEENAFLILNGDMIQNDTRNSVGSPFEAICRPSEQKKRMVEYLAPIKDKILCITSGNHERRSLKDADDDPAYDISCKLDLEEIYRQNAAFLKLQLGHEAHGKGRPDVPKQTYILAVTHGSGGGIYTGATVNRNERWGTAIDGADCVIVGHTHKGAITRPAKIQIDARNNFVNITDYLVMSCVSWQKYGGYPLQKMMIPSATSKPQRLYLSQGKKEISILW